MIDFAKARVNMVDNQIRTVDVTDADVLGAFLSVPRERFVPPVRAAIAYVDMDVKVTDGPPQRFLMEAGPFARLVQLAEIRMGDSVLLVGAGTGYGAAILSHLTSAVVALEEDAGLAAKAEATLGELCGSAPAVVTGKLENGVPNEGPYDVILFEGSVDAVPDAFFGQLKEGGRLVAVVGRGRTAQATIHTRANGGVSGRSAFDVAIPPLPGFTREEAFSFSTSA